MPPFLAKHLFWLVLVGGLLPLALLLLRLQATDRVTWHGIAATAVYVFLLRRVAGRVAERGKNPGD